MVNINLVSIVGVGDDDSDKSWQLLYVPNSTAN